MEWLSFSDDRRRNNRATLVSKIAFQIIAPSFRSYERSMYAVLFQIFQGSLHKQHLFRFSFLFWARIVQLFSASLVLFSRISLPEASDPPEIPHVPCKIHPGCSDDRRKCEAFTQRIFRLSASSSTLSLNFSQDNSPVQYIVSAIFPPCVAMYFSFRPTCLYLSVSYQAGIQILLTVLRECLCFTVCIQVY